MEAKTDTERVMSADCSNEEDKSPVSVNENEKEGVPAEVAASDHDEENSESVKSPEEAPVEEAAPSEPEESSRAEPPGVDSIATMEDLDVKMHEFNAQPVPYGERAVEMNCDDDSGPSRLPESTAAAAAAGAEDTSYEEHMEELRQERDEASRHSSQLQTKLAEHFRKKAGGDGQREREVLGSERLQEYERHFTLLADLKQQLAADSETAQQQAEELRLLSRDKLDEVENEWRALVALKQGFFVAVLSRRLGKQAAQAKVESTLAAEQLRQDELMELRLEHIKLRVKTRRLEAELRDGEEHTRDPLKVQFEQLQAARLELKKHAEKQHEESLKMQKKISGSLELLSNVKEKLFWSQMEVQAKREQLAKVEAVVARKRDFLTRIKQARNGLQRDNLRLKESRGLLGNRVLLQDFEDTVDDFGRLEEELDNLKGVAFSCGRWKKQPGTDSTGSNQEGK
ncbi:cilia- and flagella-associated protein 184 [Enoplosus armatus]|uniref:cilia- and flagella-associated protein 184 n=1 Tax=Enoplosus armatus TaxID=215367 RepID=UPI00399655A4